MNFSTSNTRQGGFSLIEAMVGAVILAVVVVALTRLQTTMLADSGESRNKTHALNMANEKLEEMRTFSRYDLFKGLSGGNDTVSAQGATLTRRWSVTDQGGYLLTRVIVDWTDSRGASQTVELTSFVNETDPVRSGKVLLGAVSGGSTGGGTGGSSGETGGGTGTGTDTGGDTGTGGDSTGGGNGSDTGGGSAGDSGSSGGDSGGSSETPPPALVLTNLQECVSARCPVTRKSTVVIGFTLGDGARLVGVVASGQADIRSSGNGSASVTAPNGSNQSFNVTITVQRADGEEQSIVLRFTT